MLLLSGRAEPRLRRCHGLMRPLRPAPGLPAARRNTRPHVQLRDRISWALPDARHGLGCHAIRLLLAFLVNRAGQGPSSLCRHNLDIEVVTAFLGHLRDDGRSSTPYLGRAALGDPFAVRLRPPPPEQACALGLLCLEATCAATHWTGSEPAT
jgi:hypothetical protein